jgi:hypothetical protein
MVETVDVCEPEWSGRTQRVEAQRTRVACCPGPVGSHSPESEPGGLKYTIADTGTQC